MIASTLSLYYFYLSKYNNINKYKKQLSALNDECKRIAAQPECKKIIMNHYLRIHKHTHTQVHIPYSCVQTTPNGLKRIN